MRHPAAGILIVATMLTACQKNPQHIITVAAPPNALECVLRAADGRGYKPEQDSTHEGPRRLARPMFGREGDPSTEGEKGHITDYLTITAVNDSLRIVAIGATFKGEELAPSPRTLQHVQGFVEQCITVDRTKTVTREES
jgi:hypothetical protein